MARNGVKRGRPRKKRGPGRSTPDVTFDERCQIKALRAAGLTPREIGTLINRSRSCVYRELKRGLCEQVKNGLPVVVYEPDRAQRDHGIAQSRKGRPLKIGNDHFTAAAIDSYIIEKGYSPYAAVEAVRRDGNLKTELCSKTVYNYIYGGVLESEERHLRRGRSPRRSTLPKFNKRRECTRANGGKSISKRPLSVLQRKQFGHWEGDLVVGPKGGGASALLTLVERKTRHLIAMKIPDRSQHSVVAAFDKLETSMRGLFRKLFRSITFDNGVEFMDTRAIQSSIDLRDPGGPKRVGAVYYAHPYCSSERGSNENINSMLRRAFPKGTDFDEIEDAEVKAQVEWINSYPRKIFNGMSSDDLYYKYLLETA